MMRALIAATKGCRSAAASVMVCAALAMGACDPHGSASVEELIRRAQAHRDAGEIRASVIELKNALQKDPQNATARLMLGEAFVDLGESASADIELRRAQDLGAAGPRTSLLLAEASMMQGRFEQVLRDYPLDDAGSAEARAAILTLRGRAHLALGQSVFAEEAFKAALELDNRAIDAIIGLARLTPATSASARDHAARAAAIAPDNIRLLELRAEMAFAVQDIDATEAFYREILRHRKDDAAALGAQLGIARAHIAAGKYKEAMARLNFQLRSYPADPVGHYLRALVAYRTGDYPAAKGHSELALHIAPNHHASTFIAGAANFELQQFEQALVQLTAYVGEVPANIEARRLLAATHLKLGQASKAVTALEAALNRHGDDIQLLALMGAALAETGDTRGATAYLERAVARDPENPALRAQLGATQVAHGNVAEGIGELEKAVRQDPAGRADITLVLTHIQAKEFDKALDAARRLQEKKPDSADGFTLAGLAELNRGDRAAARAAFRRAFEVRPDDRNAARQLAALAAAEGAFDEARKHLQSVLFSRPGDVEFLNLLSQLEWQAGRKRESAAHLEEAVRANPTSRPAQITLARFYLRNGEAHKTVQLLHPEVQKGSADAAMLEVLGRAQLMLGQSDLAIATFRMLVGARREMHQARLLLAEAYESAGLLDGALVEIEQAMWLSDNAPGIRFRYARLLTRNGRPDIAGEMLAELRRTHADDLGVLDLEGEIALAARRIPDAISAYRRLFAAEPANGNLLKLVRAKQQAGRAAEMVGEVEAWLQANPGDAVARLTLADLFLSLGAHERAVPIYQQVLGQVPDSVSALNNLAWALARTGRAEAAVEHARKAALLAPDSASVLDTYGVVLAEAGRTKEAVINLRLAAQRAPLDPSIQFHLAQALVKDGDPGAARDILRLILGGRGELAERAEAERLLKQIDG